jgi:hypothetical protein
MATELVKSPANACTLYELEDNLQALANSIAMAEETNRPARLFWTRLATRCAAPRKSATRWLPF